MAAALLLGGVTGVAAERGGLRQPLEPGPARSQGNPPRPGPEGAPAPGRRPPHDEPAAAPAPPAGGAPRREVPAATSINFRGTQFLFSGGQWYRQRGEELVAIEAPAGVLVRQLPDDYSVRWVAGVPYFHANGLYYVWRERQQRYEILQAPPGK